MLIMPSTIKGAVVHLGNSAASSSLDLAYPMIRSGLVCSDEHVAQMPPMYFSSSWWTPFSAAPGDLQGQESVV